MKIAISVLGDVNEDNGTVVRAKRVRDLIKDHHEVTLVYRGGQIEEKGYVAVSPTFGRLWNIKLLPIAFRGDFDCIYCASDFVGFFTYFLFPRYRMIIELHGIISDEYRLGRPSKLRYKIIYKILRFIETFVVRRAERVIALSDDIAKYYSRFNEKTTTLPVFVDTLLFKRSDRALGGGRRKIGLIGPFDQGNINYHTLELIKKNLQMFDDNIDFVCIGRIDEDQKLRSPRIEYTGFLPSIRDYINKLEEMNAVVIMSIAESFGALNKILEPMALNVPVITNPKGVIGIEGCVHDENIIIIDERELVETVNSLMKNDPKMTEIGIKARTLVERHHSSIVIQNKLLETLRKI